MSSQKWTRKQGTFFSILSVLLIPVLGACGLSDTSEAAREPLAERPEAIVRVPLSAGDTHASIEEKYGGRVIVWHEDRMAGLWAASAEAAQGPVGAFAIIGGSVTGANVGLDVCDAAAEEHAGPCWEENGRPAGQFLANAEAQWRGLSRRDDETFAGGRSTIWNEGEGFFAFADDYNQDVWDSLDLATAQDPTFGKTLGDGVTVAVIDTGVDLDHPFLRPNLTGRDTWLDLVDRDFLPQEIGDYSGSPGTAAYGHGTAVAGIILQVAPNAQIMPIRVLGPDGSGHVSDVVEGVHHAINSGADVINLSLGSVMRSESLNSVISLAGSKGIFVTMSAGNTAGQPTYPAAQSSDQLVPGHRFRLAVTSVDDADVKSDFAAYGSSVGLAAPGESIWSPAPQDHLAAWSGTSMAAPMAAGALALALGESSALSVPPAALTDRLKHSGDALYVGKNADFEEWTMLGHTRLNFWAFMHDVLEVTNAR